MAVGSPISSVDYNAIRDKIINILGNGSGQVGYGQTASIVSSSVSAGSNITKKQWDDLRYDIYNVLAHQNTVAPAVYQLSSGEIIKYGASVPNILYDTLSNTALTNKFNIGVGQYVVVAGTSAPPRILGWTTSLSSTVTVTFASADAARYFFNSGSKIRFTSTRSGGSSSPQNAAWSALLNSVGTVEFGAIAPSSTVNFYSTTNSASSILVSASPSGIYGGASYSITVQSDVVNNVSGGATVLTFSVTWADSYAGTNDLINGLISLEVTEVRAAGVMLPSGNNPFFINSPTYSATAITGT